MKTVCSKVPLSEALRVAGHAATKVTPLPILQNALIRAQADGTVQIACTDLETYITVTFQSQVDEPGAITVPVKLLSAYINTLTANQVTLSTTDSAITITSNNGKQKSNMKTSSAEEFPQGSSDKDFMLLLIDLPSNVLHKMITRVVGAADKDANDALGGIYCHRDAMGFHMVGLDSFRMVHTVLTEKSEEKIGIIIPVGALKTVHDALPNDESPVRFSISDRAALFACEHVSIATRVLAGVFPNYEAVGRHPTTTTATFNRAEMIAALEIAALFAKKLSNKQIQFRLEEGSVGIIADDADLGNCTLAVPCAIEGALTTLRFNYKYLLYALKNVPDKRVTMLIHTAEKAVRIDTATCTHVVMPLAQVAEPVEERATAVR